MKKILCFIFVFSFLFSGCSIKQGLKTVSNNTDGSIKGVWLTYSELDSLLMGDDFKRDFKSITSNLKVLKITDLFVHIRPFGDSLFRSDYFPMRESVAEYTYDVFEFIIDTCHKQNIRVHAWINPYRICPSTTDINALNPKSTVYGWLTDQNAENDINVCVYNGIYLNPASTEARRLVIDGIREIALNYQIDGIHFDDYFYPTTAIEFDKSSYEKYLLENPNPLELSFWRRANVNALISGCYTAIKFINKDIIFSISPAASVGKNYSEYYADVSAWIKSDCIDWIIPQLYFGFEYPTKEYCFEQLLSIWKNTIGSYDTKLIIGLAPYKIGTQNEPDREEWNKYDDILLRQTKICNEENLVKGYVFFSYSSLFSSEKKNKIARELLIKEEG